MTNQTPQPDDQPIASEAPDAAFSCPECGEADPARCDCSMPAITTDEANAEVAAMVADQAPNEWLLWQPAEAQTRIVRWASNEDMGVMVEAFDGQLALRLARHEDLSPWDNSIHLAVARDVGHDAAKAMASWVTTDQDQARRLVAMLDEDGDMGRIEAYLPDQPNLSGEWADGPTPDSLVREVLGMDPDQVHPEVVTMLADAWDEGAGDYQALAEDQLRRTARTPGEDALATMRDQVASLADDLKRLDDRGYAMVVQAISEHAVQLLDFAGKRLAVAPDDDLGHYSRSVTALAAQLSVLAESAPRRI